MGAMHISSLWEWFHFFWENPEVLRETIEDYGALAPLVFIAIQALQVVFAPLPGEVTGFVAGYLFGAFWGFVYAMIGIALGSSIAFFLARKFRHFFGKRLARSPHFLRLERFMQRRGIMAAFLCYLFPGFPKDYLNYFLGLFPIPFRIFLLIMIIGRIPGTLALALQGASLYERNWIMFAIIAGISAFLLGLFYWKRNSIYQYLDKNAHSIS